MFDMSLQTIVINDTSGSRHKVVFVLCVLLCGWFLDRGGEILTRSSSKGS